MVHRTLTEKNFIGRKDELTNLYSTALDAEKAVTQSIFLSGTRGIGKTELLKQLYNHLFWQQDRVAPFYYRVNNGLLSLSEFSKDYLSQYICQRLAFEGKDTSHIGQHGLSIERLSSIAEEGKSAWALELLDRYDQSYQRPADSLRIALGAPHQSVIATGRAVIVIIDEFQRLKNLHIQGTVDSTLVALFEEPISSKKSPHIITGNKAETQEILFSYGTFSGGLQRIDIRPLRSEDSGLMFSSLLDRFGVKSNMVFNNILDYLMGNPLYIKCMAMALRSKREVEEKDFWRTYIGEISSGNIFLYWSAVLKSFFPDLTMRRKAIEILNKINSAEEPLTQDRISKAFSLSDEHSKTVMRALYFSDVVTGEFGIFRIQEDRVLRDFIECLYMRVILEKSLKELEERLLERLMPVENRGVSFEMTIPMVKQAELVAATTIEQIGKNLHFNPDVIGQIQMAVIEGCINAMEHSKSEEKKIYLSFDFDGKCLTISIESSGREFVSSETGEPFIGRELKEDPSRGWGIKLMKSFADSVRFEKTKRGRKVILVKNLQPKESSSLGKVPVTDE